MLINPATNAVTATIDVGIQPYDIAYGFGSIWVTNFAEGTVFRIDPARNRVVRRIQIGSSPAGLAIWRSAVWVGHGSGNLIMRISPSRNRVVKRVKVGPNPVWLAAKGYSVFASLANARSVARVDERLNRRVRLIRGLGRQPVDGGIVAGDLWVPNLNSHTVTRIDLRSNRVRETIRVGPGPYVVPDDPAELWVEASRAPRSGGCARARSSRAAPTCIGTPQSGIDEAARSADVSATAAFCGAPDTVSGGSGMPGRDRRRRQSGLPLWREGVTSMLELRQLRREEGQTMAEYGVVLAVITVMALGALMMLSANVGTALTRVAGLVGVGNG